MSSTSMAILTIGPGVLAWGGGGPDEDGSVGVKDSTTVGNPGMKAGH